jgi:hypothetical protein
LAGFARQTPPIYPITPAIPREPKRWLAYLKIHYRMDEKENMVSRKIKLITGLLTTLAFMIALVVLSVSLLPFEILKMLGDRFAQDGSFDSLTPTLVATFHLPGIIVGSIFVITGLSGAFFHNKFSQRLLLGTVRIERFVEILRMDFVQFCRDLRVIRLEIKESVLLVLIMIVGIIPRAMLLSRPIEYDEAYTFIAFARRSFLDVITDYHVPNNHVFHTILVRVSYLLFGDQAWQIRFPVFIAGILIIFCTYLLGRMLYNKQTGYLAAGIVASLPVMIFRSVSARGYPIISLMTLLGFITAGYIIRRKNMIGWILFVLFCVIGLYTVPVMLYPVGFLFLWLLSSIRDITRSQYTRLSWIKHIITSGLFVVFFTFLLYSPILIFNNIRGTYDSITILHPISFGDFIRTIPEGFSAVLTGWQIYLPAAWGILLAVGLVISLWQIKRKSKYSIPTHIVLLLSTCVILLIQHPAPVNRIWLWMVPILIVWSSSGIVRIIQLMHNIRAGNIIGSILVAIIVVGMAINGIQISHTASINLWGEDPPAEEITLALIPKLDAKSTIIVSKCVDAYYWFYFFNHGVPISVFYKQGGDIEDHKIFVIHDYHAGCGSSPVDDMLSQYGIDLSLIDFNSVNPVIEMDDVTVYEVQILH